MHFSHAGSERGAIIFSNAPILINEFSHIYHKTNLRDLDDEDDDDPYEWSDIKENPHDQVVCRCLNGKEWGKYKMSVWMGKEKKKNDNTIY